MTEAHEGQAALIILHRFCRPCDAPVGATLFEVHHCVVFSLQQSCACVASSCLLPPPLPPAPLSPKSPQMHWWRQYEFSQQTVACVDWVHSGMIE